MFIKGIISEDFINYKKVSMTIIFPYCTFKCGKEICQNNPLINQDNIDIKIDQIVDLYMSNTITESIVMQGLEPFDSWQDLYDLIQKIRVKTQDDIVIYTGYTKEEIKKYIDKLIKFKNIVIKFGRYIPNQTKHYDEILGICLASDNQYAERIC